MIEQFQALPLTGDGARVAYPLVYLHDASISLSDWLQFVRAHDRGDGGLMTIRDCRGLIHALFSYRIDLDLRIRRRLCIGDMIVAHLPGGLIDAAIAASARDIAADRRCETILIARPFAGAASRSPCPTALALGVRREPAAMGQRN